MICLILGWALILFLKTHIPDINHSFHLIIKIIVQTETKLALALFYGF